MLKRYNRTLIERFVFSRGHSSLIKTYKNPPTQVSCCCSAGVPTGARLHCQNMQFYLNTMKSPFYLTAIKTQFMTMVNTNCGGKFGIFLDRFGGKISPRKSKVSRTERPLFLLTGMTPRKKFSEQMSKLQMFL